MNTNNSSARPLVGVVELPDLAERLSALGVEAVTGPTLRDAAAALKAATAEHGPIPVIAADVSTIGLKAWVKMIAKTMPCAVVRSGDPVIEPGIAAEVQLPATIDEILAAVGVGPVPGGHEMFPAAAADASPVFILPDFPEDAFEEPVAPAEEMWSAPAPAPALAGVPDPAPVFAAPASAPVPAAAPAYADMPWNRPAPHAAPAQQPAPAWQAPAPAQQAVPAPPAWEVPAPAQQSAPAWQAPAPAQQAAPALPAWEVPAPAQQAAPAWQAPDLPAQQAAPVWEPPAQAAPAQQAAPAWEPPAPAPAASALPAWDATAQQQAAPAWQGPAPAQAEPAQRAAPAWEPAASAAPAAAAAWDAPAQQAAPAWEPPAPTPRTEPAWAAPTADQDIFEAPASTARTNGNLAQLLVVFAGKGGVGKSTLAELVATRAAEAGLKTVLIDGNVGQGDLRTMLRLHRTDLPTIYDASVSGDPRKAWLNPDLMNEHRTPQMGKVPFAFVAAAPPELFAHRTVTPEVYRREIEFARRQADLVIVDTQIMEAADQFGLFDRVLRPALRQDAWGLGIADGSNSGVNNLVQALHSFEQDGIPRDRLMVMLNRIPAEHMGNLANAPLHFEERADYIGTVSDDHCVKEAANQGLLHNDHDELNTVVRKALHKVTGNAAFTASPATAEEPAGKTGIFSRFFARKAA